MSMSKTLTPSCKQNNKDDLEKAIYGLDIFTKNWCMDCEQTKKKNELTFRCEECEFCREGERCMIKCFAFGHEHNYPMSGFGSMGSL